MQNKCCVLNTQISKVLCLQLFPFSLLALLNAGTHRGAWRMCAAGPSYSRKRIQNTPSTMTMPSSSHARALALLACRVGNFLHKSASHHHLLHCLPPHKSTLFYSFSQTIVSIVRPCTNSFHVVGQGNACICICGLFCCCWLRNWWTKYYEVEVTHGYFFQIFILWLVHT